MVNLSFDEILRDTMVSHGVIPKLVELLKLPAHRDAVYRVLYHISIEDKCKSMFVYTDAIPLILQLILQHPGDVVQKELIALTVNLTANQRNAEIMCEQGLHELMARMKRTRDPLLMKVVRNLAQHEYAAKQELLQYIPDLVMLVKSAKNADELVEALGILGSLNVEGFDFSRLLMEPQLTDLLYKNLLPHYADDDVVLEVVIFIGTLSQDPKCAPMLAKTRLIQAMFDLLADRGQEDEEITLQICYAFVRFVQHPATRNVLLNTTQAANFMIRLLHSRNDQIRQQADMCLDFIMETDEEWSIKVRAKKFRAYNAQWIRAIDGVLPEDEYLYADETEPMLDTDVQFVDNGYALDNAHDDGEYSDEDALGWDEKGYN
eukprot:TRINITY_DN2974_c0_g1_i2.p1 TRINITY_DN2974_c0_g1~~TRINITY_DN2974_c0_g1_i2.p1  ORF type:complete len:376 (-),score=90.09 TRINITY_DN2974_c0_g1_i2:33-1160(-)